MDIREGRKYDIWLLLASQRIDDFVSTDDYGKERNTLIDLSSIILILGAGSGTASQMVCKALALDDDIRKVVDRLHKADEDGANMVAYYNTSRGVFVQYQFLNMGGAELWSYSTDPQDKRLRKQVFAALGINEGLRRLAQRYPGGSCVKEYERRKETMGQTSVNTTQDGEEVIDLGVIDQMAKELLER